ncbi:MFS transporter [Nonomuraea sp. NPDC050663]|uniref:MFS transporter n=1 Tax=Nonomuraea sp. NPDC050663 TaxID=3364370 RepID=UPI003793C432
MKRWLMLAIGVNAHTSVTLGLFGLPLVMPDLQRHFEVSLPVAGLIGNAPGFGILVALVPWGALADRRGERLILGLGVGLAAVLFAVTGLVTATGGVGTGLVAATGGVGAGPVTALGDVGTGLVTATGGSGAGGPGDVGWVIFLLALAGAAGAAAMVSGGRIVLRWFEPRERGVAMGLRQISYTLGMALAAFVLPPISERHGIAGVLMTCAAASLLAAVLAAVLMREPPAAVTQARQPVAASPYGQQALWRVHATSALQVVPQVIVGTYGVAFLAGEYGWSGVSAGQLFGVAAIGGVAIRIVVGRWSDRTSLRMSPLRILTWTSAAVLAVLVVGGGPPAVAVASVITVAGNGLAYLAAGELAGAGWGGRVLGLHNTIQNVVALVTVPVAGVAIAAWGFEAGFAAGLLCTLVSVPVIPVGTERSVRRRQ